MKRGALKAGLAVLLGMLLTAVVFAAAAGYDEPPAPESRAETVIIELRVWQHVDDAEDLWVSGRPKGGRWDTLGTIPLPQDGNSSAFADIARHRFGDIPIAVGVLVWPGLLQPERVYVPLGLRVWQRLLEPERIYVQACARACPERVLFVPLPWRPLGMVPLPLDDGYDPSGLFRYGDLEIAVPRGNPGLLADREHLLALRDVFEGAGGAELDWSAGRLTADWEGITVAGTPPRVTGLDLANRRLSGELWGYLGNLTELTELRLNGNALSGTIPSKLSLLTKLTHVYLGENQLQGCVPPPLYTAADHDLGSLGLPACPVSNQVPAHRRDSVITIPPLPITTDTYYFVIFSDIDETHALVFDPPAGRSVRVEGWGWTMAIDRSEAPESIFEPTVASGAVLWDANDDDPWLLLGQPDKWLFLDGTTVHTTGELERSPYSGCVYDCRGKASQAAWVEQLAASIWVNTAIGADREWNWP